MTPLMPIFIVSVGRSGSTVFQHLLGLHPSVAWLFRVMDLYPDRPELNRLWMRALDLPVIGPWMAERYGPDERYEFWEYRYKGFRLPCRDLRADDVTASVKRALRAAVGRAITARRSRFVAKITGWPRIGFLKEVFPDAKFIHVVRDGRAVANSFLNMPWWLGWRGPSNWHFGPLPAAEQCEWDRLDRSFVALAAIQWRMITEAVDRARQHVSHDNFLEVKYEQMCAEPLRVLSQVMSVCDLASHQRFEDAIRRIPFTNANDKWRTDLTAQQHLILEQVLRTRLDHYGYS
jgi:hypothetical protein